MVVALIALFVALGGSSYAALRIGSKQIVNNSIRSKDIKNGQVRSRDVGNGSLIAKDFKAGQLPAGTRGPQGPRGATGSRGARGATGPATGPAGGALTGSYPNPQLRRGEDWHLVGQPGEPPFFGLCGPWSNLGGIYPPVGFYRDPLGIVHLKGVAAAGTFGNCQIFSLPAGWVPAENEVFAATSNVAAGAVHGQVRVDAGGAVRPEVGTANISLSGITFRCAPSGVNGCP